MQVVLSPGVQEPPTNSLPFMTTAMSDQDQKLLDVEREAVIRLMRHCHDLRDKAIRDGDQHGTVYWDGAMYFGRKLFEMEGQ